MGVFLPGIVAGSNDQNGNRYGEQQQNNQMVDKFQNAVRCHIRQKFYLGNIRLQHFVGQYADNGDFDDISLLSESLEAQEKFREYVVSELTKKNVDLTPKNEFKLDISERTLNMIARSMAKKIAKHVSAICSQDAKSQAKLEDLEEENKRLEQKARHLEEQNKKLRLLLAESNKNLNSYKPSVFGLYKKVPPQNNK